MLTIKTQLIEILEQQIHTNQAKPVIDMAIQLLKEGQVVAFPTETVYGLGANAMDEIAVAKIFQAKGRPSDNPLIVHVGSVGIIESLVDQDKITTRMRNIWSLLAEAFWPGPLTIILPVGQDLATNVTAGLDTVGVRIPDHPVALALLQHSNIPIAAPSANLSGKPSPTTAQHVYNDLNERIPLILDGGETGIGIESTVLDISSDVPIILRPGGISLEQLQAVIGDVQVDPAIQQENIQYTSDYQGNVPYTSEYQENVMHTLVDKDGQPFNFTPKSPGMKYAHYAPSGEVLVFFSDSVHRVVEIIKNLPYEETIGIICSEETYRTYFQPIEGRIEYVQTHDNDSQLIASNIYRWLREVDQCGIRHIFIEALDTKGVGYALMNRLIKAAGGRVV